jgi:hypothetical protein
MSERSVLRLLKKNYPAIYDELSQKPMLSDQQNISILFSRFIEMKGLTLDDTLKNKGNSRMVFIAVVIKAFDPQFIVDEDKPLGKGLRKNLSELFRCQGPLISYISASVRTYLQVYKPFKEEVAYIYEKIVQDYESESNVQAFKRVNPLP